MSSVEHVSTSFFQGMNREVLEGSGLTVQFNPAQSSLVGSNTKSLLDLCREWKPLSVEEHPKELLHHRRQTVSNALKTVHLPKTDSRKSPRGGNGAQRKPTIGGGKVIKKETQQEQGHEGQVSQSGRKE